jgi:hypothetical protein
LGLLFFVHSVLPGASQGSHWRLPYAPFLIGHAGRINYGRVCTVAEQAVATTAAPLGAASRAGWPLGLFRGVATFYAVATLAQPFLAGMFLSGSFSALKAHEVTGQAIGGLGFLTLLCAVLLWRLRGGSTMAIRMSAGLLVVVVLEILLGYDRILALHIPLGVGLVIGIGRLSVYAWREAGR